MEKAPSIQRKIFKDADFILLNINAFLVIFGYGLAVVTRLESVETMRILKSFFLIVSAIVMFKDMNLNKHPLPFPTIIYLGIFSFWIFTMSIFSTNLTFSILRSLTFLAPLIYVYLVLQNLLNKYPSLEIIKAFTKSFNLIYTLPVLAFLASGAGFSMINIYGSGVNQGQFFVSNQYGWACAIYLVSIVDILLNTKTGKFYKIFNFTIIAIAIYLLLISGNRASWVSILLAIAIFLLRLKNIRPDFKIILTVIPIAVIFWFYQIPESSLQTRLSETESQIDDGEPRLNTAKIVFEIFNEKKSLWITGAGMFNYDYTIHGEGLADYHNSYLEVLFGGGIILFLLFITFMLFRPLYHYAIYYSKHFLIIMPVLVIPFFESNLTGGQFVFFPWFIFMILFNMPPHYDDYKYQQKPKVLKPPHYRKQT